MRPAREEKVKRVKAGDMLARFIHRDLFLEFFTPDPLETADVFVRDLHVDEGTPRPLMKLGGMPGRLRCCKVVIRY